MIEKKRERTDSIKKLIERNRDIDIQERKTETNEFRYNTKYKEVIPETTPRYLRKKVRMRKIDS